MRKQHEIDMMRRALDWHHNGPFEPLCSWEYIIDAVPPKQAYRIFIKWSHKGYWDYGVSARSGWLTEYGVRELRRIVDAREGE